MADETLDPMVQFLTPEGNFAPSESAEEFMPYFQRLTEADHRKFYRDMVVIRAIDTQATNLQRQGQLALWPQAGGSEATPAFCCSCFTSAKVNPRSR